jgi:hypothetical protein
MSQPHTSKDLSFVRHPTRQSTYLPGRQKAHYVFAWSIVLLGIAILFYMATVIAHGI